MDSPKRDLTSNRRLYNNDNNKNNDNNNNNDKNNNNNNNNDNDILCVPGKCIYNVAPVPGVKEIRVWACL